VRLRKEQASFSVIVLLFLSLLVTATPQQTGIQTVKADAATIVYASDFNQTSEFEYAEDIC